MYAVIKAGTRQFKVSKGDTIDLFKMEQGVGESVDFDKVLMIGGEKLVIGSPFVNGAKVTGVVKEKGKSSKILVFKYKRRKNYKKMIGHRQDFTTIEISDISF